MPSASWTIVSFSDAHSLPNLGRELTVFHGDPGYDGLAEALAHQRVDYSVEFYPGEGKYHYSGHRKCGVRHSPEDTQTEGYRCGVCQRPLTLGVLHRIRALSEPVTPGGDVEARPGDDGFVLHEGSRPPFIRLIPLVEVIADILGQGPSTRRVAAQYQRLTRELGSELQVLMTASETDLAKVAGENLAQAIMRGRVGDVRVDPGYDGVYGKIHVWPEGYRA